MNLSKNMIEMLGSKAPLRVRRGESRIRGTQWRHVSHLTWGKNNRVDEDQLRDFLQSANNMFGLSVEVEDPYRKNRFIPDFLIHSDSLAVMHRSLAYVGLKGYGDFGRLSVLWPYARVGEGVSLGTATEVRPQAYVGAGAHVGDRSLVSKYSRLGTGAQVGAMVFVGAEVRVGENSEISSGAHIARGVTIGSDVQFGQGSIGQEVTMGDNGFYDFGVTVGHHSRLASNVMVGEGVRIAPYSTVGSRVIIGAGNAVGQMGSEYPTAYIEDGTFIPAVYESVDGEDGSGFRL